MCLVSETDRYCFGNRLNCCEIREVEDDDNDEKIIIIIFIFTTLY